MILLVPQWQGAGKVPGLAAAIGLPAEEIPLEHGGTEAAERGILYRAALLSNLDRIQGVLEARRADHVLTVGGDCSVELGPVSWLRAVWGESFHLLWLDAHPDLNTPESSPSGTLHGMPLRHLLGEGDSQLLARLAPPLASTRVRLVGPRSLDPAERTFIAQHGLTHVGGSIEDAGSARELADRIVPSGVPVYLHVDLDLLDPGTFGGLCCPEPGGWSPEALTAFCARVHQRCHVVGLGLMEHLPRPGADLAPLAGFLELARTLLPGGTRADTPESP